jgi:hypothetical protein
MKAKEKLEVSPIAQLQRLGHLLACACYKLTPTFSIQVVGVQRYSGKKWNLEWLLDQHVHECIQKRPAHLVILKIVRNVAAKTGALISDSSSVL